jgi:hypothetical protein
VTFGTDDFATALNDLAWALWIRGRVPEAEDESRGSTVRPTSLPHAFLDHHGSSGGFYFGCDTLGQVRH